MTTQTANCKLQTAHPLDIIHIHCTNNNNNNSSSSSSTMSIAKTYDYLVLLVVALCAYILATVGIGMHQDAATTTTTSGSSSSSASQQSDGSSVLLVRGPRTDKATGILFLEQETFPIVRQPMSIVGVGTRKKAILNIYSVGLFVSKPLWKELAATARGPTRCQAISDSKAAKAVKLTFAMGIGPEKIAEAVSGIPSISETVRKKFHDLIVDGLLVGGGKLKRGESMSFQWKGGDTIAVSARGKAIGSIKDINLAKGVLALYVGPKSVSPSLLADLKCR